MGTGESARAGKGIAGREPAGTGAARLVRTLAGTLATVSSRLEAQGGTADEVGLLVARAEALAERSRALATLPYPAGGTFSSLAGEIDRFGAAAEAVAARAAAEAGQSRALALEIRQQLATLQGAGESEQAELRARLEGVLAALAPLSGRLQAVAGLAAEVSGLGERAAEISERNGDARGAARLGNSAALALSGELRGFAEAASAASETLLADNYGMRQVMVAARDRAQDIVIELAGRGAAPAPARETAEPLKAMVWTRRPFGRRSFG